MTTIGIIGSGHVGSNLAKTAIAHGYDVVLSNSQGPDSLTTSRWTAPWPACRCGPSS